jgi:hypothetical protein
LKEAIGDNTNNDGYIHVIFHADSSFMRNTQVLLFSQERECDQNMPLAKNILPDFMLLLFGATFSPCTGVIQYKSSIHDDQNSCCKLSKILVTSSTATEVRLKQQLKLSIKISEMF